MLSPRTANCLGVCIALGACTLSTSGTGPDVVPASADGGGRVTTAGSGGNVQFTTSSATSSSSSSSASSGTGAMTSSSSTGATGGSGGAPPQPVVYCNGADCAPGQVCCIRQADFAELGCVAAGICPIGSVPASCNDPDDCPGSTCCATYAGVLLTLACAPSCAGPNQYVMCNPNAPVCPPSTRCKSAAPGYNFCG